MFVETSSGRSITLSLLQLCGIAFVLFWGPIALGRRSIRETFPDVPDDALALFRVAAAALSVLGAGWFVNGIVGLVS